MAVVNPRTKYWSITLNNYTDEDLAAINLVADYHYVAYMVYGFEVGQEGTPHLQGCILLKERRRLTQMKETIGDRWHIEPARDNEQLIAYCKKDGNFVEFGTLPDTRQGRRSDLDAFKEDVTELHHYDLEYHYDHHSKVCAKYPKFVDTYIRLNKPKHLIPPHEFREWQHILLHILLQPPDERQILFVVDRLGNKGKSWFAKYYCQTHIDSQIITPGKFADMAYLLRTDIRVLFIDTPRCQQETLQYNFLEKVKDQMVQSPKYETCMKYLPPCHVVVLMNHLPDMALLSHDRYHILDLDEEI